MIKYNLNNLSLQELKVIQFALDSHQSEQNDTGFKMDAAICEQLIKRIDRLVKEHTLPAKE